MDEVDLARRLREIEQRTEQPCGGFGSGSHHCSGCHRMTDSDRADLHAAADRISSLEGERDKQIDIVTDQYDRAERAESALKLAHGEAWAEELDAQRFTIEQLESERDALKEDAECNKDAHAEHHTVEWNSPAEADAVLRGCSPVALTSQNTALRTALERLVEACDRVGVLAGAQPWDVAIAVDEARCLLSPSKEVT